MKGEGSYLLSIDGTRFLDAISSWWVNLHGHSHKSIVEAIANQAKELDHVLFARFTHKPAIELSELLLSLLPENLTKIFYSDNGSTAIETALKMNFQYWNLRGETRPYVVHFRDAYHGETLGTMSASGNTRFGQSFWPQSFPSLCIDPPLAGHEESSYQQLKTLLDEYPIGCFIFEPLVQVSAMRRHSAKGLDALIGLCKRHGILTIADEVMTGFGRLETLFACDSLSNIPDFICLAKSITGGTLPLGATACSEEIYQTFSSDSLKTAFLHGHTYTANPIACSAAIASLKLLLEPDCLARRQSIQELHRRFVSKHHPHPKLKRCESIGTLLVCEFRGHEESYHSSIRDVLERHFLDRGILLRPLGNVLYVMPPYSITQQELMWVYEAIESALEVTQ